MDDVFKPHPGSLLLTVIRRCFWCDSYFFGVGVSCRILYSFVGYLYMFVCCSGTITSVGKREPICLLSFTCNYVVSVRRDFLFLWVLGLGCVCLLWHSLSLPYIFFEVFINREMCYILRL